MSSPMYGMPEHFPMGFDVYGNGPAEGDEIDHIGCWCGTDDCKEYQL